MDKTDVLLSQLLMSNSRLTYRELADHLDLSVNAVHKRIQSLLEAGIIRKFTAKISLSAVNGFSILIFGRSEAPSIEETCEKIGSHELTYWVSVAGGNYLYIGAYLQNLSDLDAYVTFIQNEAQILDANVGIESPPEAPNDPTFYPLDYQIIYSLHENARKPLSEIAEELGVSAKTVRRRLSRMVQNGLIELSIKFYPDVSNDILTMFHLHLKESTNKKEMIHYLMKKYAPNIYLVLSFSNIPNILLCLTWNNTMKEVQKFRKQFQSEEFIASIIPNVLYTGYIFDTWRDTIVLEKGNPNQKTSD